MIYNGNLDRSEAQRRSVQDPRTELKTWERGRNVERSTVNDVDVYQVRSVPLFSFPSTSAV
jgi:hypothetical protein